MKNFTRSLAVCVLLTAFFNSKGQENALLKSFINKNDIALRGVQKYSINLSDHASIDNVKELLIIQMASVKLFTSNPEKSADIAYTLREKCVDFFNKNSKGNLEYLKLSDKETAFFSSPKQVEKISSYLNKSELKKISSIDVKDPHLFDDLKTRIQ